MSAPSVLLLGATGYIGGQILTSLLALVAPPSLITCLVRDPAKASLLETIQHPASTRIASLVGSLAEKGDRALIADAAEQHEVVINAATADEPSWLEAVFEGVRRRKAAGGKESIFIHTSGTGMFHDDARGAYATDKVSTTESQLRRHALNGRSTPTTIDQTPHTCPSCQYLRMYDTWGSIDTSLLRRRRSTSAGCSS